MIKKTLWVFGHSLCLPHDLENDRIGWANILSNKLKYKLKNFSCPAASNFYIYNTLLEQKKNIKKNDIIIIGWSHPNRKTFIYDNKNKIHQKILKDCRILKSQNKKFIKSNTTNSQVWTAITKPRRTDSAYFDKWFFEYFNEQEQQINFQSYLNSVELSLQNYNYIPFYFNKESIKNLQLNSHKNNYKTCMMEFILKNKCYINKNNLHFDLNGHHKWYKHIHHIIKELKIIT